jgi:hypothetical protein
MNWMTRRRLTPAQRAGRNQQTAVAQFFQKKKFFGKRKRGKAFARFAFAGQNLIS